MEAVKHQNNQICTKFSKSHSLKLATKFLTSLILFCVIFSSPSLLVFMFNFMQISSDSINKNYIFLLCNGILVLIVKNSGFNSNNNSHQETFDHHRKKKALELPEMKTVNTDAKAVKEEIQDKVFITASAAAATDEEEEEEKFALTILEGEQGNDDQTVVNNEDDEEEEAANGLLSAEELNKKCDDFIRKMKEEIKIESQQLIVVQY